MEIGYAFIFLPGELAPTRLGTLELDEKSDREISGSFTYSKDFLDHPKRHEIDPRLPTKVRRHVFGNTQPLFGVFEDASPDDWGKRVIEQKLGVNTASRMQYLVHSSSNRIGAIVVNDAPDYVERDPGHKIMQLSKLMKAAELVEGRNALTPELADLLGPGPSAGGARPKDTLMDRGRQWLAKFPSRQDNWDVCRVEAATLAMARDARINVPDSRLVKVGNRAALLIERFDRVRVGKGAFTRRHCMSALTAFGLGPNDTTRLSYPRLAAHLRQLGGGDTLERDCEYLFRRMVFNLFIRNNDDHGKNHAFMLDADGALVLSPTYDIVPQPRAGETFYLAIGLSDRNDPVDKNAGRLATVENALSRCEVFGLKRPRAIEIMEEIRRVVVRFPDYFRKAGVLARDRDVMATQAVLVPSIDFGSDPSTPAMSREATRITSRRSNRRAP